MRNNVPLLKRTGATAITRQSPFLRDQGGLRPPECIPNAEARQVASSLVRSTTVVLTVRDRLQQ
jgi:hypothetical protein